MLRISPSVVVVQPPRPLENKWFDPPYNRLDIANKVFIDPYTRCFGPPNTWLPPPLFGQMNGGNPSKLIPLNRLLSRCPLLLEVEGNFESIVGPLCFVVAASPVPPVISYMQGF